jgi:hypothetical protein
VLAQEGDQRPQFLVELVEPSLARADAVEQIEGVTAGALDDAERIDARLGIAQEGPDARRLVAAGRGDRRPLRGARREGERPGLERELERPLRILRPVCRRRERHLSGSAADRRHAGQRPAG